MVSLDAGLERLVSHDATVIAAIRAQATTLAMAAGADLARHRETGNAHIEVEDGRPDSLVSLVDEAALSIEYGRGEYTRKDGTTVGAAEGLHILGKLL